MNSEELRAQVVEWLNEVKLFAPNTGQSWNDYVVEDVDDTRQRMVIYTNDHSYQISFTDTYMGCVASCRKPRAGEDWIRSNDLHDGPFSRATFIAVMLDIVGYELVAKVKPSKPMAVESV